jgi:branched-chain amino acid transport system substrate-binding protein
MNRITKAMGALTVLAVLAAACGDDDEDGADTTTTTEAVDDTTTTEADDGGEGTTTEPVELTDSFRGVTADTITLGYTQIDFDALRDQFGVDLNFQNAEPVLDALVDELNERGGINGRMVEVIVDPYLPVGSAQAEESCVRLTQDEQVFAVLSGFDGNGAVDVNPCFPVTHDTALVGGQWTEANRADATAPWIEVEMAQERRSIGFAEALVDQGYLDADDDRVALLNSTAANEALMDEVEAALDGLGIEVVFNATIAAPAGDTTAAEAETRTILERARTDGATAVLYSGVNPSIYPAFSDYADLEWYFDNATTTQSTLQDFAGAADLGIVSNGLIDDLQVGEPLLEECIAIVEERTDLEIVDPGEVGDQDPFWWQAVITACQHLRLFEMVATAAGPDLTNESFLAAAEGLGEFSLPGLEVASLGAGKYDAGDTTVMVEWDPAAEDGRGGWSPIGEPFAFS